MATSKKLPAATDIGIQSRDFAYKISLITPSSPDGKPIRITNIVNICNIYENIFSPVITGTLEIIDPIGLLPLNQMHGNEYVEIIFGRKGISEQTLEFKKIFRVFKISDRQPGRGQEQKYVMHFCSEEQILSNQVTVCGKYSGETASIIEAICSRFLKTKKYQTSGSMGISDYMINRLRPFDAIDMLSKHSYDQYNSPMLFFENRDGFRFYSLSELFKQPSLTTLNYSTARFTTQNLGDEAADYQYDIAKFNMSKVFDVWASTKNLTYSALHHTVDPLTQKYNSYKFDARNLQDEHFIDGSKENIPMAAVATRGGPSIFDQGYDGLSGGPGFVCLTMTNLDQSKSKYFASKNIKINNTSIENTLTKRQSILNLLKNTIIDSVAVVGSIGYTVGVTIDFNFPAFDEKSTEAERSLDPYMSGKYLITGVRHNLTKSGGLQTFLSLAKNSLNTPLSAVNVNNPSYRTAQGAVVEKAPG